MCLLQVLLALSLYTIPTLGGKTSSKHFCSVITLFLDDLKLQVVTIATSHTEGYERFMRSSNMFSLDVEVGVIKQFT